MIKASRDTEPPQAQEPICIGITLGNGNIQVAARSAGREIGNGRFPNDSIGTAALLNYLADWQNPLRLAVATAGTAALGLALSMGAAHGREIFLVAGQATDTASHLAHYAERAI